MLWLCCLERREAYLAGVANLEEAGSAIENCPLLEVSRAKGKGIYTNGSVRHNCSLIKLEIKVTRRLIVYMRAVVGDSELGRYP